MRPEPIHIVILLVVILLIFGAPKLPMIAKNLGKSMKIFKSEVKDLRNDDDRTTAERHEITDAAERPADPTRPADRTADPVDTTRTPAPGDEQRPRS